MQTQHDDFEAVVGQGPIDLVHDQALMLGETRIALDAGFTKQLGASLVLPVRFVDSSIRYLRKGDGADVDLVTPGIHHRDETLTGFADPMLLGVFTSAIGPARVVLRGGFTIPIGRTEDNPFSAVAETMPHQHVQFGTGTVNPVVSADVSWARGAWRFGGFALTQQTIYENSRGYKAGDRYAGGLVASRRLGKKWSLRGGAEVQAETAERWNGIEHTDDGNRGRFDAMFVAGGSYLAGDRLAFDVTVKVPFITAAVGGQLDMPAIVEVGASWRFGKLPARAKQDDHDHDHEHAHDHDHDHDHGEEQAHDEHAHDEHAHEAHAPEGEEHAHEEGKPVVEAPTPIEEDVKPPEPKTVVATKKIDIADYNKPGEAPDLVPIKGKLTIFDFWAAWCAPCKTLDAALVDLAKKHPNLIAIRKLDVIDWDSKAAERYLTPGGFDLPHLKIYDPSGKRVLEKSSAVGKLDELIADTRAIVEREATTRGVTQKARSRSSRESAKLPTRVAIVANAGGFAPSRVTVPKGVPVTFVFERTDAKNCASEVVFEIDGKKHETKLPAGRRTEVTHTFGKPGTVKFACGMDMYRGSVEVR